RGRPAHLQPVRLARHAGDRARPAHRTGARGGARREGRARDRAGGGEPLPPRPARPPRLTGARARRSRVGRMAEPAAVLELPRRRSPAAAALVAMRPRQWTKNLLLFAGIIFA